MDRICTRCARLALQQHRTLRRGEIATSRTFVTSSQHRVEDSADGRAPSEGLRITRVPARGSGTINSVPTASAPRPTQILRRTGPPRTPQAGQPAGSAPGPVLRRNRPSSQPGQVLQRSGPPRQGGRPGQQGKSQGPAGKQRRRRTAESVKVKEAEDELPTDDAVEEYLTKFINRPANPTTRIEYNPKAQETIELQKDWPNTPLSPTGLSASLIQKIEWLARRIPHGYQTPEQLAEHFQKGNLTRFESEEEKQKVLKIAAELAQKRAAALSERKGSEVAAEDMGLSDLSSRDEKNKLVNEVIKGDVAGLERQRMPFLDSVMRNLDNNQTYHKPQTDKFMSTVQRLMPSQTQRRPQQQAQKRA